MKALTILGSTGSIGVSTLDVVLRNPERYRIHALAAGQNTDLLAEQVLQFHPQVVVTGTNESRVNLISRLRDSGLPDKQLPEVSCDPTRPVGTVGGNLPGAVTAALRCTDRRRSGWM